MLVLIRKTGERVVIRDSKTKEVLIVVESTLDGDKVRLGFEADRRFEIWREELDTKQYGTQEAKR